MIMMPYEEESIQIVLDFKDDISVKIYIFFVVVKRQPSTRCYKGKLSQFSRALPVSSKPASLVCFAPCLSAWAG